MDNNFGPLQFRYRQVSLYTANFVKDEVDRFIWNYYMKSMKCLSSKIYVDHMKNLEDVSVHTTLGY
jgi:hypothetical protein